MSTTTTADGVPTGTGTGTSASQRPLRLGAEATRSRLLGSGLRLFALQGYSKTSTRELAEDADANVAAISYHFGDKAGLYRAVFCEPAGLNPAELARRLDARPDLADALHVFFAALLDPLRDGDQARLHMKLHFREMLEPTGLCADGAAEGIRPVHEALLARLGRHFGLAGADDELQRLTVCIAGLGVHLHVGHDAIGRLAPRLFEGDGAIDRWIERLVQCAVAMVEAETRRRGAPAAPAASAASAAPTASAASAATQGKGSTT